MAEYDVAPWPGFDPEVGLLLAALEDSKREWLENLGRVSKAAVVWQAHPEGPSIGALMLHMADCEAYWFEQFLGGRKPDPEEDGLLMVKETDQDRGRWPTPHGKPFSWYVELHAKVAARARESLRGLDAAQELVSPRKNRFTVRWVVAHVLQHDSYHGGQMVILHEMYKRRTQPGGAEQGAAP